MIGQLNLIFELEANPALTLLELRDFIYMIKWH